jgi:hypothetical protein
LVEENENAAIVISNTQSYVVFRRRINNIHPKHSGHYY